MATRRGGVQGGVSGRGQLHFVAGFATGAETSRTMERPRVIGYHRQLEGAVGSKFLDRMVDRMYAALGTGPAINCRPHASRQRIDLEQIARLGPDAPGLLIARLLGTEGKLTVVPGRARPPATAAGEEETEEARAARKAWEEQQAILQKLRVIAEDARTFENDTGAHPLHLGFPLLHLPTTQSGAKRFGVEKRIIAPVAFVPVTLTVRAGRSPAIELACAGEGVDRVIPNQALLAWIEQQTGERLGALPEDPDGTQPWTEINGLVALIARALRMEEPAPLGPESALVATPRASEDSEARILPCAVLGLYPLSNQSLLRDLEAMAEGESLSGPVESFVRVDVGLAEREAPQDGQTPTLSRPRAIAGERLVSEADPCQARAVEMARRSVGLVVHGPPGTGKSQTITNIIGDHLARGDRVLFVCDKRTALDVVLHRLDHLGLGNLCAIVHDAQRDQRDLYRSIREQLESLAESKTNPAAVAELEAVDAEIGSLHEELTRHEAALSTPPTPAEPSFHELAGRWFEIDASEVAAAPREITGVRLSELLPLEKHVREVLERARKESYPGNPWRSAIGIELGDYLAVPQAEWRGRIGRVVEAARAADATALAAMPAFSGTAPVEDAAQTREALADRLGPVLASLDAGAVARWAGASPEAVSAALEQLEHLAPQQALATRPLDPELAIVHREKPVTVPQAALWIASLLPYLAIAHRWYRFLLFWRGRRALAVLRVFGLALAAETAERGRGFLDGVRARAMLQAFHQDVLAPGAAAPEPATLPASVDGHRALLVLLREIDTAPGLLPDARPIRAALVDAAAHASLIEGLRRSPARARAIVELERRLGEAGLFSTSLRDRLAGELRAGGKVHLYCTALEERLGNVEGLLRIEQALSALPGTLREATSALAEHTPEVDAGVAVLEKAVLAGEISRRLREDASLHALDADRLRTYHERHRSLDARRRGLVREAIAHRWVSRQRERLLASTGTRLSSSGAELKRRLALRGERAMRVRQVIAAGASIEGGDGLFDLRPVWMASPETVAQIFPRAPIFDVVIFDEASQCRLEEALPVLARARRLVIAGDPKQLPPTRFFESAVAQSQEAEAETEQELFEEQQSEIEDLLGAALNLEIEQCYLDVHYRSRNSDLIEFSNASFYDRRLQAIPGHPRNRAVTPPLRLEPVAGVYDKRANLVEAQAVVRIVRELLARESPPSIGIACFNLTQRDAILQALDEAANADPELAGRLAVARSRRGAASFEGLFVKNLENVQGDERDHMIISTTYGRDPQGRFYRRFGPLGRAGGGRRLNVLVTRAREEVHLVTSIPPEVYRADATLEPGRTPNGAWLLFSYLRYAEELACAYADEGARLAGARVSHEVTTRVRDSGCGSRLARALGASLADRHDLSSDVHWGNDGFCVDIALHHPHRVEDVTVGVLCDRTRFDKAADRVEWDLFRTAILEGQGWTLLRLWSPAFFRDPEGALESVRDAASRLVAGEPQPAPPHRPAEVALPN